MRFSRSSSSNQGLPNSSPAMTRQARKWRNTLRLERTGKNWVMKFPQTQFLVSSPRQLKRWIWCATTPCCPWRSSQRKWNAAGRAAGRGLSGSTTAGTRWHARSGMRGCGVTRPVQQPIGCLGRTFWARTSWTATNRIALGLSRKSSGMTGKTCLLRNSETGAGIPRTTCSGQQGS